jgi:hypothetical protein
VSHWQRLRLAVDEVHVERRGGSLLWRWIQLLGRCD